MGFCVGMGIGAVVGGGSSIGNRARHGWRVGSRPGRPGLGLGGVPCAASVARGGTVELDVYEGGVRVMRGEDYWAKGMDATELVGLKQRMREVRERRRRAEERKAEGDVSPEIKTGGGGRERQVLPASRKPAQKRAADGERPRGSGRRAVVGRELSTEYSTRTQFTPRKLHTGARDVQAVRWKPRTSMKRSMEALEEGRRLDHHHHSVVVQAGVVGQEFMGVMGQQVGAGGVVTMSVGGVVMLTVAMFAASLRTLHDLAHLHEEPVAAEPGWWARVWRGTGSLAGYAADTLSWARMDAVMPLGEEGLETLEATAKTQRIGQLIDRGLPIDGDSDQVIARAEPAYRNWRLPDAPAGTP